MLACLGTSTTYISLSLPPSSLHQLIEPTWDTQMSSILAELAANPSAEILDALRGLERKTTTVFTLLKASVYSIVLQQQMYGEEDAGGGG